MCSFIISFILSLSKEISFVLTIFAGTPTAVTFFGMSFKTIAPAPILEFSPITIFPSTLADAPIITLFSIVGCLLPFSS